MTFELPPPRHGQVLVPTLNGNGGAFLEVDCSRRTDESPQRWTATGLGIDPAALEAILTESRDAETGPEALAKVRIAVFPREPVGNSHGLAIALADKLARFPPDAEPKPIFATGVVLRDGRGRLAPVEGFAQKARMVADAAPKGSVFAFCKANEADARPVLDRMRREGRVCLHPATMIGELAHLWASPATTAQRRSVLFPRSRRLGIVLGGTLLAVAALLAAISLRPVLLPGPEMRAQTALEEIEAARALMREDFPQAMRRLHATFERLSPEEVAVVRRRDPSLPALARVALRQSGVSEAEITESDTRVAAYLDAARAAATPATSEERARNMARLAESYQRILPLDRDRHHPDFAEAERIRARVAGDIATATFRARRAERAQGLQELLQGLRPELDEQLAALAASAKGELTPLDEALAETGLNTSEAGFVPQGGFFPPRQD